MNALQQWLQRNAVIALIGAIFLLVVSIMVILSRTKGAVVLAEDRKAWFYDMDTGVLYIGAALDRPPIWNPERPDSALNPKGVRAYVFSCGECDEKSRFIGYLETYPPGSGDGADLLRAAYVEGRQPVWFPEISAEAQTIVSSIPSRCGGNLPQPCEP